MTSLNNKLITVPDKVNDVLDKTLNDKISRLELSRRVKGNGLFIVFVLILVLFYIANGYSIEKLQRESNRMERKVNDLRIHSIAVNAELMRLQRASVIERNATDLGLVIKQNNELPVMLHK